MLMQVLRPLIGIALGLLLGMGDAVAARDAPLVDKGTVFEGKEARTLEQVRDYILLAAEDFNPDEFRIKIESDEPGVLQLELNKQGKNFVSVRFDYTGEGFQTQYLFSKALNYRESNGQRFIHPSYMVWIDQIIKLAHKNYRLELNAKGDISNSELAAQITVATTGLAHSVRFARSEGTDTCSEFAPIGRWFNSASDERRAERDRAHQANIEKYKDSILWRKSMGNPLPPLPPRSRTMVVAAAQPILIRGRSNDSTSYQTGHNTWSTTSYSCGPLFSRFAPQGGRKYSVEFAVSSSANLKQVFCQQIVFDVTDPAQRVPVPSEPVTQCDKKPEQVLTVDPAAKPLGIH